MTLTGNHVFFTVAKCIKSDRIILYSKYGTVLPAIQREEALVSIIVKYIKFDNYSVRVKDAWPLFRFVLGSYISLWLLQ